jgi:hypothetical protein
MNEQTYNFHALLFPSAGRGREEALIGCSTKLAVLIWYRKQFTSFQILIATYFM